MRNDAPNEEMYIADIPGSRTPTLYDEPVNLTAHLSNTYTSQWDDRQEVVLFCCLAVAFSDMQVAPDARTCDEPQGDPIHP